MSCISGNQCSNSASASSLISSSSSSSATDDIVYRRVGRFECYECVQHGGDDDEMSEDAEALFEHWFPEIQDMTQLDNCPLRRLTVI
jgi:hypothetical protein